KLAEADYRGEQFKDWPRDLKNNNDLLSITQPHIIEGIHRQYLEAGAEIIETNTFNSQSVTLEDFGMAHLAYDINLASARRARQAVDKYLAEQKEKGVERVAFVAGALGPTTKSASLSPDVNNPAAR